MERITWFVIRFILKSVVVLTETMTEAHKVPNDLSSLHKIHVVPCQHLIDGYPCQGFFP